MRKILATILCVGFLFAALSDNIATNGNFDTNITGWSVNGTPATFAWSESGGGFNGSMHLAGNSQYDGTTQVNIPVTAGKNYQFAIDVNLVSISEGTRLRFCCYNATDSYIGTRDFVAGADEPGVYSLCDTIYPTVSNSTRFWFLQTNAGAYEVYIDNVSLREIVPDPISDTIKNKQFPVAPDAPGFPTW